jgi:hypothetical protein
VEDELDEESSPEEIDPVEQRVSLVGGGIQQALSHSPNNYVRSAANLWRGLSYDEQVGVAYNSIIAPLLDRLQQTQAELINYTGLREAATESEYSYSYQNADGSTNPNIIHFSDPETGSRLTYLTPAGEEEFAYVAQVLEHGNSAQRNALDPNLVTAYYHVESVHDQNAVVTDSQVTVRQQVMVNRSVGIANQVRQLLQNRNVAQGAKSTKNMRKDPHRKDRDHGGGGSGVKTSGKKTGRTR